jgi:hypothetical protein
MRVRRCSEPNGRHHRKAFRAISLIFIVTFLTELLILFIICFKIKNPPTVLLRAKKVGHQISVSFEQFDVVQALLSFFDTIPIDSLKIDFILLFSFSKCPLFLIKVYFDWNFALNKYSLRAYSFPTTYNT